MRVSPVLTGLRAYPFVRLADERLRLLPRVAGAEVDQLQAARPRRALRLGETNERIGA